jgi:hypothetical protein
LKFNIADKFNKDVHYIDKILKLNTLSIINTDKEVKKLKKYQQLEVIWTKEYQPIEVVKEDKLVVEKEEKSKDWMKDRKLDLENKLVKEKVVEEELSLDKEKEIP